MLDASAAVTALLNDGLARRVVATDQLHAPHLIDSEVANAVRRHVVAGRLPAEAGWRALDTFRRLGMTRYPAFPLLDRVWQLRERLSAYDACYVALAEALDCAILTADARLSRAAGMRCSVTVVPG